ncbi:hypothetical protein M422DRAFT_116365, partial [Sphaerobolus stellatus SS14]
IDNCVKNHENCPSGDPVPLPTRVIHVGKNNSQLKIVEPSPGISGSYVAVSYSWGSNDRPDYTLKGSNHTGYLSSIDPTATTLKTAQTIMDAIHITRWLGIKYLWVDALCIIQPEKSDPKYYQTPDFHLEAPNMGQYYSKAYLTISAAWINSATDGCFSQTRPQPPSHTIHYHNTKHDVRGKLTIVSLPLEKENLLPQYIILDDQYITNRAWTLQERILSPRTLFYGTDQMYWECNEHFSSEDGFHVKGRMFSTDKHTKEISLFGHKKHDPRELWFVLLQSYGNRLMGNPMDKLAAVAGLAEKFGKIFSEEHKNEYMAGLWKRTIVEDLFW